MDLNASLDPRQNSVSFTTSYGEAHLRMMGRAVYETLVDEIVRNLLPAALEHVRNNIDWKKITDAAQAALIAHVTKDLTIAPQIQVGRGYQSDSRRNPGPLDTGGRFSQ